MLFAFNEMKMSKLLIDSGMNMISSPVQAHYPIFERTFNPNNFCHQRHILKILSVWSQEGGKFFIHSFDQYLSFGRKAHYFLFPRDSIELAKLDFLLQTRILLTEFFPIVLIEKLLKIAKAVQQRFVKLIQRVKIVHLFLQFALNLFHFIILSFLVLHMAVKNFLKPTSKNGEIGRFNRSLLVEPF